MLPLSERPFSSFFEPELAEQVFVERAPEEIAEGMIVGRDQPVFPNRDTAIAIGIDVSLRLARDPAADLEDLGFAARIALSQLHSDIEFGDWPAWGSDGILLKYEIRALDMDFLAVCRGAQLRLVKGDRSLGLL